MAFQPPSAFAANRISPGDSVCDALAKVFRQVNLVAEQQAAIYQEDGSFTTEMVEKICATGCGGQVTTTTGGDVTTTTSGSDTQLYDTAGTFEFTVPGGVTEITIVAVAGGGGGGGLNIPFGSLCSPAPVFGVASGGGSGEARSGTYSVTPGEILTIIVGAGGGQTDPTQQGVAGNPSSVLNGVLTTLTLANGGAGGAWGCCPAGPFAGGAGGSGGTGGTGTAGNAGGATTASPGCASGSGGASVALTAGAGSAGSPNNIGQHPGGTGAVRLTW